MMIQMRDKAGHSGDPSAIGRPITCEEFQAQMPELIGGNVHGHEHLRTCQRCAALLEELEYIARIAGDLMLPVYEPRDDVWKRIETSLPHAGNAAPSINGNGSDPSCHG